MVDFGYMNRMLVEAFAAAPVLVEYRYKSDGSAVQVEGIREDPSQLESTSRNPSNLPMFFDRSVFPQPPERGDSALIDEVTYDVVTVDYDEGEGVFLGLQRSK